MLSNPLSIDEIATLGAQFHLEHQEEFERKYLGQFVVVDVEKKDFTVSPDRLKAIELAQKKFGEKLFYIIQVSNIRRPNLNYSAERYAWDF